jgi:hypothetical protein
MRVTPPSGAAGRTVPAAGLFAPTYARFRAKLAALLELEGKADATGLRAVPINPVSSNPKALARYRGLAMLAIEAREGRASGSSAASSPGNCYWYDFDLCSCARGWAQVDTALDASWFGTWASPTKRTIFSFAEGDFTRTICDTDEEFAATLREMDRWNRAQG